MQGQLIIVSGRLIIDDWHERYFLFVHATTHITLGNKLILCNQLPATDPQLAIQLIEGIGFDGRTIPSGFSANPADLPQFRILRVFEPAGLILDTALGLSGNGDRSRGVTVRGHTATDAEIAAMDRVTSPSIKMENLATFESIQERAFEIFQKRHERSAMDNWLEAETELLARPSFEK